MMQRKAMQINITRQHIISIIVFILLIAFYHGYKDNNDHTIESSFLHRNYASKQYYIFGYGSLINAASRVQTGITGQATPVRVHHMKRGWIYDVDSEHHPSLSNTPYTA